MKNLIEDVITVAVAYVLLVVLIGMDGPSVLIGSVVGLSAYEAARYYRNRRAT